MVLNDSRNKKSYQSSIGNKSVWRRILHIASNVWRDISGLRDCSNSHIASNVNRLTTNRLSRMTSWDVNLHIACNV